MIEKEIAILVRYRSLRAVEELSQLLFEIKDRCSDEDFISLRRGVGSAIGRIQVDLLRSVYLQFPNLSDLPNSEQ